MSNSKFIIDLYNDPKNGLMSPVKLFHKIQKEFPNKQIKLKEVKKVLNNKMDVQLLREIKRPKEYNTIYATKPGVSIQMDIINYNRYKTSGKYQYILCIIDVYSRYAWCFKMTTREMKTIMLHIKSVFNNQMIPNNINCDNEFNKNEFNKWCKDNKITTYFSDPEEINKNAIVERFNRTLALRFQRWRLSSGLTDWTKVLDDVVEGYNNSVHRTIKAKPIDVLNGDDDNKQEINVVKNTFHEGDLVRTQVYKKIFDKGDEIKTSLDIYRIEKTIGSKYQLKNLTSNNILKKLYKSYELLKVDNEDINTNLMNAKVVTNEMNKQKITNRVNRRLKKANVKQEDIIQVKRTRKPKSFGDDFEMGDNYVD
jgi:hypothetical protein